MELLLLVATLISLSVAPLVGDWILRPLVRHAGGIEAPRRFLLSDLIWLMLQLQAVIALGMQLFDRSVPASARIVIVLVFCVPVVAIWATSLHVASRAGIRQPLRRALVVLVVIPLGMVVAIALPVLIAAFAIALLGARWGDLPSDRQLWIAGPLLALALASAVWLRWVARWTLRGTGSPERARRLEPQPGPRCRSAS